MALLGSGTAQHLTRSAIIVSAAPMSYACWYKPNSVSVFSDLITQSSQTVASGFLMYVSSGATLTANAKVSGASASAVSVATLSIGTWYHCVAVFVSTTSRLCYLNGVSASNATSATPITLDTTAIGCEFAGTSTAVSDINGTIAYPTIWNIALTAADVAALYNSGVGSDPRKVETANLQSFTLFTPGSVTPWTDSQTGVAWTTTGAPVSAPDPFSLAAGVDGSLVAAYNFWGGGFN